MSISYGKQASHIGAFLKENYQVSLREISARRRRALLNDTTYVQCDLCGSDDSVIIAKHDKFDLPVQSVICKNCGLIYLNPRPSDASLKAFYEGGGTDDGVYHRITNFDNVEEILKEWFGQDFEMTPAERQRLEHCRTEYLQLKRLDDGKADEETEVYGTDIGRYLLPYLTPDAHAFEVGASNGRTLSAFRDIVGCQVSGVEPKVASCEVARERWGVDLIAGFSDHPDIPKGAFDIVLILRTINHMVHPLEELRRAYDLLKPGGLIFIGNQDSIEKARFSGFASRTVEIDHMYMFSINTLKAYLQKAGFEILKAEVVGHFTRKRDPDERDLWEARIIARKIDGPIDESNLEYPGAASELARLVQNLDYFADHQQVRAVKKKKPQRKLKRFIKRIPIPGLYRLAKHLHVKYFN